MFKKNLLYFFFKRTITFVVIFLLFTTSTILYPNPAKSQVTYAETYDCHAQSLTNYQGLKVKQYDYDAFGNIRLATGTSNTNYEFQSQQLDPESSMYFLRARYYDPTVGRFISRDPVKGTLTNPQSQNGYSYAHNNPINYSDPSGEFVETAWDLANIVYDIATCDWGALAFDTGAAFIPFVPAGITKVGKVVDKVQEALKITFGHGARHLEGTGLAQDVVESAIKTDIAKQGAGPVETYVERLINVEGKQIEYHPYTLKDGTINVGTYFLVK